VGALHFMEAPWVHYSSTIHGYYVKIKGLLS